MTARDHLEALVTGLPDGTVVTVRADWIKELLSAPESAERATEAPSLDLTVEEVAAAFQCTPQCIRNWLREGRFPRAWHLGREWRIPRADVVALGCREVGSPEESAA